MFEDALDELAMILAQLSDLVLRFVQGVMP